MDSDFNQHQSYNKVSIYITHRADIEVTRVTPARAEPKATTNLTKVTTTTTTMVTQATIAITRPPGSVSHTIPLDPRRRHMVAEPATTHIQLK
jgi:hypothetical protein